jgi:hypothetical protein
MLPVIADKFTQLPTLIGTKNLEWRRRSPTASLRDFYVPE